MNEAASSWGVADATCRIFAEERIARRRQGLDDRPPHRSVSGQRHQAQPGWRARLHDPCLGTDSSDMTLAVIGGVALVVIAAILFFRRLNRNEAAPMDRTDLLDRMNKVL